MEFGDCNCPRWHSSDMNGKCDYAICWSICWYPLKLGNITKNKSLHVCISLGFTCLTEPNGKQKSEGMLYGKILICEVGRQQRCSGPLHPEKTLRGLLHLPKRLNWKMLRLYQNWICSNTRSVVLSHPTRLFAALLPYKRPWWGSTSWRGLSWYVPEWKF